MTTFPFIGLPPLLYHVFYLCSVLLKNFCHASGLNIKDVITWNKEAKTALVDHFLKKDKLWVRWINGNYMKGRSVEEFKESASMSWMVRQIFPCYEHAEAVGGCDKVQKNGVFSIALMYQQLGDFRKVPWSRLFV